MVTILDLKLKASILKTKLEFVKWKGTPYWIVPSGHHLENRTWVRQNSDKAYSTEPMKYFFYSQTIFTTPNTYGSSFIIWNSRHIEFASTVGHLEIWKSFYQNLIQTQYGERKCQLLCIRASFHCQNKLAPRFWMVAILDWP